MTITLQSLLFDRETTHGDPAAVPVLATREATVPPVDWQRTNADVTATAVAYPIGLAQRAVDHLSVTVTFCASAPPSCPIFIRARADGGRLLGDVAATEIAHADWAKPHRLALCGPRLREAFVDDQTVAWIWEGSEDGVNDWRPFDRSIHRVFVTLDDPVAPWGRPGVPHTIVPWEDVMALFCRWAAGHRDPRAVMKAVTTAVDALAGKPIGREILHYDGLGSLCVGKRFFISDLLLMAHGSPCVATELSCRDLNTAVAMGTTVLGVALRMIRLRRRNLKDTMDTNPIRLFGEADTSTQPFCYHEVAAAPAEKVGDRQVCDACLRIDFDPKPEENPPSMFGLSAGLAIAENRVDLGYLKRLTAHSQDCVVEDVEFDGIRYPEDLPKDGPATPADDRFAGCNFAYFVALMREAGIQIDSLLESSPQETSPESSPAAHTLPTPAFALWLVANVDIDGFGRRVEIDDDADQAPLTVRFAALKTTATDIPGVVASLAHADSGRQAARIFLALVAAYTGALKPLKLGDFAVHDAARGKILTLRGNVVTEVRRDGNPGPAPDTVKAATTLDAKLAALLASS